MTLRLLFANAGIFRTSATFDLRLVFRASNPPTVLATRRIRDDHRSILDDLVHLRGWSGWRVSRYKMAALDERISSQSSSTRQQSFSSSRCLIPILNIRTSRLRIRGGLTFRCFSPTTVIRLRSPNVLNLESRHGPSLCHRCCGGKRRRRTCRSLMVARGSSPPTLMKVSNPSCNAYHDSHIFSSFGGQAPSANPIVWFSQLSCVVDSVQRFRLRAFAQGPARANQAPLVSS